MSSGWANGAGAPTYFTDFPVAFEKSAPTSQVRPPIKSPASNKLNTTLTRSPMTLFFAVVASPHLQSKREHLSEYKANKKRQMLTIFYHAILSSHAVALRARRASHFPSPLL